MQALLATSPPSRLAIQCAVDSKSLRRQNLGILEAEAVTLAEIERRTSVSASYLSQIKNGYREMGDAIARQLEAGMRKRSGWMDQPQLPHNVAHQLMAEKDGSYVLRNEPAEFPVRGGTVTIDVLDVKASMGLGLPMPERETVIDSIRVPQEWVRDNLPHISSPANLRIITGYGDSMWETFSHGDPLIVDIGVTEMKIDAIYVFAMENELFIKRIQRLPGGALKVISDNRAKYDAIMIEAAARAGIQTLARVVCAWNLRKL